MHADFANRFNDAVSEALAKGWIADDSQLALAALLGLSGPTIWSYRKGTKLPRMATAKRIAATLRITSTWLLDGEGPRYPGTGALAAQSATMSGQGDVASATLTPAPPPRGRVPVISAVQAGHPTDVVDNFQPGEANEWLEVSCQVRRHTFALVVEGDSMEPEFTAGMRIVVEPEMEPENGDYVVAGNGEQATLKKLVRDGNDLYLKPLNPRYPIKPLGENRIIGVVREAHRKYR